MQEIAFFMDDMHTSSLYLMRLGSTDFIMRVRATSYIVQKCLTSEFIQYKKSGTLLPDFLTRP